MPRKKPDAPDDLVRCLESHVVDLPDDVPAVVQRGERLRRSHPVVQQNPHFFVEDGLSDAEVRVEAGRRFYVVPEPPPPPPAHRPRMVRATRDLHLKDWPMPGSTTIVSKGDEAPADDGIIDRSPEGSWEVVPLHGEGKGARRDESFGFARGGCHVGGPRRSSSFWAPRPSPSIMTAHRTIHLFACSACPWRAWTSDDELPPEHDCDEYDAEPYYQAVTVFNASPTAFPLGASRKPNGRTGEDS